MKQLLINNPNNKKLSTTTTLIMLAMQYHHTSAEMSQLQQLLEEHEQAGIICKYSYIKTNKTEEPLDKPIKQKYKGITYIAKINRYKAYINAHGKKKHIGVYMTEREALEAYQMASLAYKQAKRL